MKINDEGEYTGPDPFVGNPTLVPPAMELGVTKDDKSCSKRVAGDSGIMLTAANDDDRETEN